MGRKKNGHDTRTSLSWFSVMCICHSNIPASSTSSKRHTRSTAAGGPGSYLPGRFGEQSRNIPTPKKRALSRHTMNWMYSNAIGRQGICTGFPRFTYLVLGNHDLRPFKAAASVGLGSGFPKAIIRAL